MARLKLPALVGDLRLLECIAEGPVTSVYLAARPGFEDVQRLCAVKLIDVGDGAGPDIQRFLHEARLLLQLEHAGVVRVFDAGRAERYLYLAMEHVHGRTLAQVQEALHARDELLTVELAVFLVREVLEALDYAHRLVDRQTGAPANIVHRGLAPGNIVLGFDGQTKILGFSHASSSMELARTRTEDNLGQLSYISPEQLHGEAIDGRADLFAVAVILTELLLGQRFEPAGGRDRTRLFPAEGAFRPPGYDELEPMLRMNLDRALALEPRSRFSSCAAFADALRDYQVELRHRVRGAHLQALMAQLFEDEQEVSARRINQLMSSLHEDTLFAPTEADTEFLTIAVDYRVASEMGTDDGSDVFGAPESKPTSMTPHFDDATIEVGELQGRGVRTVGQPASILTEAYSAVGPNVRHFDEKRTELEAPSTSDATSVPAPTTGQTSSADHEPEKATVIVDMSADASRDTSPTTQQPNLTPPSRGLTGTGTSSGTQLTDDSRTVITAHSMTGPMPSSMVESQELSADLSAETAAAYPLPELGEGDEMTQIQKGPIDDDDEGVFSSPFGEEETGPQLTVASEEDAGDDPFEEATIQNDPQAFMPLGGEHTLKQELPLSSESDVPSIPSTDYELISSPEGATSKRPSRPLRPKGRRGADEP